MGWLIEGLTCLFLQDLCFRKKTFFVIFFMNSKTFNPSTGPFFIADYRTPQKLLGRHPLWLIQQNDLIIFRMMLSFKRGVNVSFDWTEMQQTFGSKCSQMCPPLVYECEQTNAVSTSYWDAFATKKI